MKKLNSLSMLIQALVGLLTKKIHTSLCLIIILLVIIILPGCQQSTELLSENEIQVIKNEINTAFEQSATAASEHKAEEIMNFLWNNDDLVYAANGNLIKGWSNFSEVVEAVHTNPKNQGFRLVFESTYVKVINRDCALVTGKGKLIDFPTEEGPIDKDLTVTFLFEKIDGKWLISAGHESTPENLF